MKKNISKTVLAVCLSISLAFTGVITASAEPNTDYFWLSELTPTSWSVGWGGTYFNDSALENRPISLWDGTAYQTYTRGVCAHAGAELVYDIAGSGADRITFDYGVNRQDSNNVGNILFYAYIDGVEKLNDTTNYNTGTRHGVADIAIPEGAKTLRLVAVAPGSINNCHAIWANPRLYVTSRDRLILQAEAKGNIEAGEQTEISLFSRKLNEAPAKIDSPVATYVSGNPSIATVDAKGIITGVSSGSTYIDVTAAVGDSILTTRKEISVFIVDSVKDWILTSPGGQSKIEIYLDAQGSLKYRISQAGKRVVELSPIGFVTSLGDFSSGLTFGGISTKTIDESYPMISGKASTYVNRANELTVKTQKNGMNFDVVFRAYDDGAAYRYLLSKTDGSTGAAITFSDESSAFVIPDGTYITTMPNGDGAFSHEGTFSRRLAGSFSGKQTMPLLYETPGGSWVLISEADLNGEYCGSILDASGTTLKLGFPQQQISRGNPYSTLPFNSPWRFAITGSLKNIVETQMMENLSAPPADVDWSWVEPGVSAWTWMQGGFSAQRNEDQIKAYVDYASEMGWKYFILDEGWQPNAPSGSGERYSGYFPWFEDLIDYAADRGVYFIAWVLCDDINTQEKRDARLAEWARMGIKGIKVDFFDRESQDRIKLYDILYQACADLHMVVNCHGANKPTGQRRTYPNVINREGIRGEEQNGNRYDQNVILTYTRGVVGPSDFTPRIYPVSGSNNTTGQQLALNILLESGIPCMADNIANYQRSVGHGFLKNLPAAWDQTEFIGGSSESYAAIARRKNSTWYVGVANNTPAREIAIPLGFLDPGVSYMAEIYKDNAAANDLVLETRTVTGADSISVNTIIGGGFTIKLIKPAVFTKLELPAEISLDQFATHLLKPVSEPASYEPVEIVWTSSNPAVATVADNGRVSAVSPGRSIITVSAANDPRIKSECLVTVKMKTGYNLANGWTRIRPNDSRFTINNTNSISILSTFGTFGDGDSTVNLVTHDAPTENFDISVKLTGIPSDVNYSSLSLYTRVKSSPQSIVSVIRRYHSGLSVSGNSHIIELSSYAGGWTEPRVADTNYAQNPVMYLRLVKNGTSFTGYYRLSPEAAWTTIGSATNNNFNGISAANLEFGVLATNSNGSSVTDIPVNASFDDFTCNGTILPFASYQEEHILEIEKISDITVDQGTTAGSIGLPAAVKAWLAAAGTGSYYPVTWDTGSFDGNTVGTYTIYGELNTGGIPCDLKAEVNVTVNKPEFSAVSSTVDASASAVKIRTEMNNNQPVTQVCQVILVAYDAAGKTVATKATTLSLAPREKLSFVSELAGLPASAKRAKLFLWSDSFVPLSDAYDVELIIIGIDK